MTRKIRSTPLAARGVRFETVIAESNWTLPSHITLFTGLSPALHGVVSQERKLAESVPMLTEVLRERGFRILSYKATLAGCQRQ